MAKDRDEKSQRQDDKAQNPKQGAERPQQQPKQAYDFGLALLKPRLPRSSQGGSGQIATLEVALVDIETRMEAAAARADYNTALTLLRELEARLAEYEAAQAERRVEQKAPGVLESRARLALQELIDDGARIRKIREEVADPRTHPLRRDLAITARDRLERGPIERVVELVDAAIEAFQWIVGRGAARCGRASGGKQKDGQKRQQTDGRWRASRSR